MIGLPKIRFAALLAAILAVFTVPSAEARDFKKTQALCAASMQEEFGAAKFSFNKMRRNNDENRQRLFGTLTLKNGQVATIRCRVRDGKVRDVKFSTGTGNSLGGQMWNSTRPEGAEYIPFEDEVEEEAAAEAEVPEGEATAEDGANAEQETAEAGQGEDSATEQAGTEAEPEPEPRKSLFKRLPGS